MPHMCSRGKTIASDRYEPTQVNAIPFHTEVDVSDAEVRALRRVLRQALLQALHQGLGQRLEHGQDLVVWLTGVDQNSRSMD